MIRNSEKICSLPGIISLLTVLTIHALLPWGSVCTGSTPDSPAVEKVTPPGLYITRVNGHDALFPLAPEARLDALINAGMIDQALDFCLDIGMTREVREKVLPETRPEKMAPQTLVMRLRAMEAMGSSQELMSVLQELIRRGDNPERAVEKALALTDRCLLGDRMAISVLQRACERFKTPDWQIRLAEKLYKCDQEPQADEIILKMIRETDQKIPALSVMARHLLDRGKANEALNLVTSHMKGIDIFPALGLWASLWRQGQKGLSLQKALQKLSDTSEAGRAKGLPLQFLEAALAMEYGERDRIRDFLSPSFSETLGGEQRLAAAKLLVNAGALSEARLIIGMADEPTDLGKQARDLLFQALSMNPDLSLIPSSPGPARQAWPLAPGSLSLSFSFLFNDWSSGLAGPSGNSRMSPLARLNRRTVNLNARIELFRRILQSKENFRPQDALKLLQHMTALGQPREALELADQYIASSQGSNRIQGILAKGRILLETDSLPQAMDLLRPFAAGIPSEGLEKDTPIQARNVILDHLSARDLHAQALEFLNSLISLSPDNPENYQALSDYLRSQSLVEDLNSLYQRAAQKFRTRNWYDALARVMLRAGKGQELRNLISNALPELDQENVASFLQSHLYLPKLNSSALEKEFYRQIYSRALKRFPLDQNLISSYLSFLRRFHSDEYLKMLYRYFAVNERVRKELVDHVCSAGEVDEFLVRIREEAEKGQPGSMDLLFAILIRLSRFEEALELAPSVMRLNPSSASLILQAETAASLNENTGAANIFLKLWATSMNRFQFLSRAGESLARAGDYRGAMKLWKAWIERYPGDSEAYRNVAERLWDFSQPDLAAGIILQARKTLGNSCLLGNFMATIEIEAGHREQALEEALNLLARNPDYDSEEMGLAILDALFPENSSSREIPPLFSKGVDSFVKKLDMDLSQLWGGLDSWLINRSLDKVSANLAIQWLDRLSSPFTLQRAEDLFRNLRDFESAYRIRMRMIQVSGETVTNLLSAAALLESMGRFQESRQRLLKILQTQETPWQGIAALGSNLIKEGQLEKLTLLVEENFKGKISRSDWASMGRLLAREGLHQQACQALERALENPFDESGNLRGETLRLFLQESLFLKKEEPFIKWIQDALSSKATWRKSFDRYQLMEADQQLRDLLAEVYSRSGKFSRALDQLIEALNLIPGDTERVLQTLRLAENWNLRKRLLGYYEKLGAQSNRDPRWQRLLYHLQVNTGNFAAALDAALKLVTLEPEDREALEWALKELSRAGREKEGLVKLQRFFNREGMPLHLVPMMIRTLVQVSGIQEALSWIHESSDLMKPPWSFLALAIETLEDTGHLQEAAKLGIKTLSPVKRENLIDICSRSFLNLTGRVCIRAGRTEEFLTQLKKVTADLEKSLKKGGSRARKTRSAISRIESHVRSNLLPTVCALGSSSDCGLAVKALADISAAALQKGEFRQVIQIAEILEEKGFVTEALSLYRDLTPFSTSNYYNHWAVVSALDSAILRFARSGMVQEATQLLTHWRHWITPSAHWEISARAMRAAGLQREEANELFLQIQSLSRQDSGSGDPLAWQSQNSSLDRLFKLRQTPEIQKLIDQLEEAPGRFSLQLLNLEMDAGNLERALKILEEAPKLPVPWKRIKRAELFASLGLKKSFDEAMALFTSLLGLHKMDRKISSQNWVSEKGLSELMDSVSPGKTITDAEQSLEGGDWYDLACHFAYYLCRVRGPGKMINALAEGAPRSASAYLRTSALLEMTGNLDEALKWAACAGALANGKSESVRAQARIMARLGREAEAFQLLLRHLPEKCSDKEDDQIEHFRAGSVFSLLETCRLNGVTLQQPQIIALILNSLECSRCLNHDWRALDQCLTMLDSSQLDSLCEGIEKSKILKESFEKMFLVADLGALPLNRSQLLLERGIQALRTRALTDPKFLDPDTGHLQELIRRAPQFCARRLILLRENQSDPQTGKEELKILDYLKDFRAFLEKQNSRPNPEELNLLTYTLLKNHDPIGANALLERLFTGSDNLGQKEKFLQRAGEHRLALETQTQAMELRIRQGQGGGLYIDLMSNLLLLGQTQEALQFLDKVRFQIEQDQALLTRAGSRTLETGYPDQALPLLEQALKLSPDSILIARDLAAALIITGKSDRAREFIISSVNRGMASADLIENIVMRLIDLSKTDGFESRIRIPDDFMARTRLKGSSLAMDCPWLLFNTASGLISGSTAKIKQGIQEILNQLNKLSPSMQQCSLRLATTALPLFSSDDPLARQIAAAALIRKCDPGFARGWKILSLTKDSRALLEQFSNGPEPADFIATLPPNEWTRKVAEAITRALDEEDSYWQLSNVNTKIREMEQAARPGTEKELIRELANLPQKQKLSEKKSGTPEFHFTLGKGLVDRPGIE